MLSSGVPALDDLLEGGFPERSAVLVEGSSESSKERMLYRFVQSRFAQSDCCIFVTKSRVGEVLKDAASNGAEMESGMLWVAKEGGQATCDVENLANLSFSVKDLLRKSKNRRIRISFDVLSNALMRNPPDAVYRFLDQLIAETKQYDAVLLVSVEQGMHSAQVLASMEQLFDGVLSLELVQKGEKRFPMIHIRKMKGSKASIGTSVPLFQDVAGSGKERIEGTSLDSHRIAVLPLVNMSPDPNDEFFADGFTEEIISTVSGVSGLSVISRTSVTGYKGTTKKINEIGRELNAGSILEGSFRKAGDRIRVTTQLINVNDDSHIWAQSYEREMGDMFAVQTDIAKRVTEALEVRILPTERERIEKAPTKSTEAYTLFLKGRHYWNERTYASLNTAIRYFEKAVEKDPNYALAYVGIADCYAVLDQGGTMAPAEASLLKKKFAIKAVELNYGLAEAHTSLASALESCNWDWEGAEREFRRAIELNPNYPTAHHWYALHLELMGRFDEAIAEIRKAEELDPLSLILGAAMARILRSAGRLDEALARSRRLLELEPKFMVGHAILSTVYGTLKMYDKAIEECKIAADLDPDDTSTKISLAYYEGLAGRDDGARKLLDQLHEKSKTSPVPSVWMSGLYEALGERDKMFDSLRKALEEHDWTLAGLNIDPDFAQYRSDPRFIDLMQKMNLKPNVGGR